MIYCSIIKSIKIIQHEDDTPLAFKPHQPLIFAIIFHSFHKTSSLSFQAGLSTHKLFFLQTQTLSFTCGKFILSSLGCLFLSLRNIHSFSLCNLLPCWSSAFAHCLSGETCGSTHVPTSRLRTGSMYGRFIEIISCIFMLWLFHNLSP